MYDPFQMKMRILSFDHSRSTFMCELTVNKKVNKMLIIVSKALFFVKILMQKNLPNTHISKYLYRYTR